MSFLSGIYNNSIDNSYKGINAENVNSTNSDATIQKEGEAQSDTNTLKAPLYTNMSSESPIIKALTGAGLPLSEENINITTRMMNGGMSIDAGTLTNMIHTAHAYPEVSPENIIDMKMYGIEINADNVASFDAFKNYESFVKDGIDMVAKDIPETVNVLVGSGDTPLAMSFLSDVIDIFAKDGSSAVNNMDNGAVINNIEGDAKEIIRSDGSVTNQTDVQVGNASESIDTNYTRLATDNAVAPLDITSKEALESVSSRSADDNSYIALNALRDAGILAKDELNGEELIPEKNLVKDAVDLINKENGEVLSWPKADIVSENKETIETNNKDFWQSMTTSQKSVFIDALKEAGADEDSLKPLYDKEATSDDFLMKLKPLLKSNPHESIKHLVSQERFGNLLADKIKDNWMLNSPDKISKETISGLYDRLDSQVREVSKSLESIIKPDMPIANSLNNMNSNMDFMHQMNQAYQYVQIPLKMNGSETTGDLFVYTNKKNLASKDGSVSALLHLDMANLGPLDVYASITPGNNVFTKFYLKDDATIDFINDNIHILNERLEKRGYSMKSELVNKTDDDNNRSEGLKAASSNMAFGQAAQTSNMQQMIKKYSLDIRA